MVGQGKTHTTTGNLFLLCEILKFLFQYRGKMIKFVSQVAVSIG